MQTSSNPEIQWSQNNTPLFVKYETAFDELSPLHLAFWSVSIKLRKPEQPNIFEFLFHLHIGQLNVVWNEKQANNRSSELNNLSEFLHWLRISKIHKLKSHL